MIKVLIIDDEPLAISVIAGYLAEFPNIRIIAECGNGYEGLKAIREHSPDLIFLDVQMPKITGFEMLELVDEPPAVIFTTAFEEYALKAFEKHAVDYLLKPISKERFKVAVEKFLNSSRKADNEKNRELLEDVSTREEHLTRVVVKDGSNIRIIPIDDVFYFEAYDDYVKINTKEDCFLKKNTMQKLEDSLDPTKFLRVHRSFILNLSRINKIEPATKDSYLATLTNGSSIPLSRTGYSRLRQVLSL